MADRTVSDFLERDRAAAGCDDAGVRRVCELFGHPLPEDYESVLRRFGGYDGDLLRPDGTAVMYFPILDADGVDEAMGYDTVAESGIAVAGSDAWRWVLQMHDGAPRYIDVELGSGDVLDEYSGDFVGLLEHVVARMDQPPPEGFGDPVSHSLVVPDDPLSLLDPGCFEQGASDEELADAETASGLAWPADLKALLTATNGYDGGVRVSAWERPVGIEIPSAQGIVSLQNSFPGVRERWPAALVVVGRDPAFPVAVDTDTGTWFSPMLSTKTDVQPFKCFGVSLADFLVGYRAGFGE